MLRNNADARRCSPMLIFRAWATRGFMTFQTIDNNLSTLTGPFPSSRGPLYQNEVKCSAFDMEMIFHSHGKSHFHKKGCLLGLIVKVRGFETRKWPITDSKNNFTEIHISRPTL